MEMALQMPSNYVEVTEDEMMYVDGGASIPGWAISFAVNAVVNGMMGGGAVTSVRTIFRAVGKSGFKRIVKSTLRRFVSVQTANRLAGSLSGAAYGFLSFSVGGYVFSQLNRRDKKPYNRSWDI